MRIGNLIIFEDNVKKLSKLISGYNSTEEKIENKEVEGDVSVGQDLYASTRIGKERENQEDAVVIMKHAANKRYKMLVVADGVGGNEDGEKASHIAVTEIREWFNSLKISDFSNEALLESKLKYELNCINRKICGLERGAATTFVCALVGKNNTIIANVGDSRAYTVNGDGLKQISMDDSAAKIYYEHGLIENWEDARFHIMGNQITACLGQNEPVKPNTKIIPNSDYDAILLFSDGVTDCLSDNQIYAITRETNHKELAKTIVNRAINTDSRRPRRGNKSDEAYYDVIRGGKDNTTAAVVINKTKGRRNSER